MLPFPKSNRTFFSDIERVEQCHLVEVTRHGMKSYSHWVLRRQHLRLKGSEEYADAFRDILDKAVHSRLRGTLDVTAQMSGGVDSTAVTATAARLQLKRGKRVVAFTSAPRPDYPQPGNANRYFNESSHAAAVAATSEWRTLSNNSIEAQHVCLVSVARTNQQALVCRTAPQRLECDDHRKWIALH